MPTESSAGRDADPCPDPGRGRGPARLRLVAAPVRVTSAAAKVVPAGDVVAAPLDETADIIG